jgi:hypothetical protein
MQLEEFLKNSRYFSLGHLPTESFHPETGQLSDQVETDLAGAIRTVQSIDVRAMNAVVAQTPLLRELRQAIEETWARGQRVFLSGCGSRWKPPGGRRTQRIRSRATACRL